MFINENREIKREREREREIKEQGNSYSLEQCFDY